MLKNDKINYGTQDPNEYFISSESALSLAIPHEEVISDRKVVDEILVARIVDPLSMKIVFEKSGNYRPRILD